jgi:H+/Cl- antiporter ClcA
MKIPRLNTESLDVSRPKTILYVAMWTSAVGVGIIAVLYARLIAHLQNQYFEGFHRHAEIVSLATPLFFIAAAALVHYFAPDAKGSGIPQVLVAISHNTGTAHEGIWKSKLVSLKTAAVKILSSCVGTIGGASIGREGPTVQIAASGFAWIGRRIRRFAPQIEFQSFLIAGAAAGVAAAFNTPLAGITFAIEELLDGMQRPFRQLVMLAVIIAGVTSEGLSGNYLYFGQPVLRNSPVPLLLLESLVLGVAGGLLGGIFAKLLARPKLTKLPTHWFWRAAVTGTVCGVISYATFGDTAGSGYEVTRSFLNGDVAIDNVNIFFPILKFFTTVFSYLAGMAGGIFSPCLSIGAGLGLTLAKLAHFQNFKSCALVGMVGFFSGAVRAPLTAVIIVMEMTNEHILVIPFMIAAYLAHSIGTRIMPTPLYHQLAQDYQIHVKVEEPI